MARKKPQSAKAKKAKLQEQRHVKKVREEQYEIRQGWKQASNDGLSAKTLSSTGTRPRSKQTLQRSIKSVDPDKELLSKFKKLTTDELEASKSAAMQPLERLPREIMEISMDQFYGENLDLPRRKRPKDVYTLSKTEVDLREENAFRAWLSKLKKTYTTEQLGYCETNIQVWRQFWRVVEISDIVMLLADIRYPPLHFSPSLYDYVVRKMRKPLLVILNKVDLVSQRTVDAWQSYIKGLYPELHVTTFASYTRQVKDGGEGLYSKRRVEIGAHGIDKIVDALAELDPHRSNVLLDWNDIKKRLHVGIQDKVQMDTGNGQFLSIGLLGCPNVGKSSFINAVMNRKVVRASLTPGKTKHFQTIHLTPQLRLVDCPGVVFPSLIPTQLQVIAGVFPIAQVQDVYGCVQWLAERVSIEQILRLGDEKDALVDDDTELFSTRNDRPQPQALTTFSILERFALQHGFVTAQAARPDVYRAGNLILRLLIDARILVSFKPPGFFEQLAKDGIEDLQEQGKLHLPQEDSPEALESDNEGSQDIISDDDSHDAEQDARAYVATDESDAKSSADSCLDESDDMIDRSRSAAGFSLLAVEGDDSDDDDVDTIDDDTDTSE